MRLLPTAENNILWNNLQINEVESYIKHPPVWMYWSDANWNTFSQAGWSTQTVGPSSRSWLQSSLGWLVIPKDTWSSRWVNIGDIPAWSVDMSFEMISWHFFFSICLKKKKKNSIGKLPSKWKLASLLLCAAFFLILSQIIQGVGISRCH